MHGGDRASGTSVSHARNMGTGRSTAPTQIPSTPGWRKSGQVQDINAPTNSKVKYSLYSALPEWGSNTDFDIFIEQVHYFEKCGTENFHGVKGQLAKHADYWVKIGASDFVLSTVKEGYIIPFIKSPCRMFLKNNKSAIINSDFVDKSVSELLASGCVKELPFTPFVVSLLSVATNKAGKQRLILDLSLLNKSVHKEKFKYEDWNVAIQLFSKGCYTFKFDLKNGYHHFDVCPQQQTYLGFSWGQKYFCFTVLPFGLLSAFFIYKVFENFG